MTRVVFMGTPDFAVPSLQALQQGGYDLAGVVTQPDRPQGRGQAVGMSPVKRAAWDMNLPVFQPERVNSPEFIEQLRQLKPDLIVVTAFGQILPESILSLPALGCINVHASLLPAYRGAAPINWAIMNGEKETGITTMLMAKGMDTGDMLLKTSVEIPPDMTYGELHDILAKKGADLLLKTLKEWKEGRIKPVPQDEKAATYAPILKKEHEIIDWFSPASEIVNKVRGLAPYPGAVTTFRGRFLKINKAGCYPEESSIEEPGTVTALVKGAGFVVRAGKDSVLAEIVQPEGKKPIPAASFINGYRLKVGEILGR